MIRYFICSLYRQFGITSIRKLDTAAEAFYEYRSSGMWERHPLAFIAQQPCYQEITQDECALIILTGCLGDIGKGRKLIGYNEMLTM